MKDNEGTMYDVFGQSDTGLHGLHFTLKLNYINISTVSLSVIAMKSTPLFNI